PTDCVTVYRLTSMPAVLLFLFLITPRPPTSTLLPYTTLFRSSARPAHLLDRPIPQYVPPADAAVGHELHPRLPVEAHRVRSADRDRKSTRLNSSHVKISYAAFCLKKKNK